MDIRQEIRLHAEAMEVNETVRVICPVCRGGSSAEKSLTITLFPSMSARYNCFRDKCINTKGIVHLTNAPIYTEPESGQRLPTSSKKEFKPQVFRGTTTQLTVDERTWIEENWGILDPPYFYHTNEYGGRVAMSVRSPRYVHRGWVLRDIKGTAKSKALTYVDQGQVPISWYTKLTSPNVGTIIVEDIPSAVRASKWITRACALLGTGCGPDRAEEIARVAQRPIMVALDQDATTHAFDMVERYSLLWGDGTKVLALKKDLKNMNDDDLQDFIERSA